MTPDRTMLAVGYISITYIHFPDFIKENQGQSFNTKISSQLISESEF